MPSEIGPDLLKVKTRDQLTIAKITVRQLDELIAEPLGEQLLALAESAGRGQLRVDFGLVDYLTSTTLAKLIKLHLRVRELGGRLVLVNLNDLVYEVFVITSLTTVLDVRAKAARRQRCFSPQAGHCR